MGNKPIARRFFTNRDEEIVPEDALNQQFVNFHPMRNDMTVVLAIIDFVDCMKKIGHEPVVTKIPNKKCTNQI